MRGAVHRLREDRRAAGHEQRGPRYAVVVHASRFDHLSRWVVVPTSTGARAMLVRPEVDWGAGPTRLLCDALTSIDPLVRLEEMVGCVTTDDQLQIDTALALLLDLAPPPGF